MVDNSIYQILAATSAITSIVSSNVYTVIAPQSDLSAYVVIHIIDLNPEGTKDATALDEVRIQIDSFHSVKSTVDILAKAIRTALDKYRGVVDSRTIDMIIYDDARNDFDDDRKLYKIMQDFIVRQKLP